jgi:hypothetical protein
VTTLAGQLQEALAKLPAPAATRPQPLPLLDLSAARSLLKGVQFVSPRGRFDVAFFEDHLALLNPPKAPPATAAATGRGAGTAAGAPAPAVPPALVLPYASVEALLVLERPPEGVAKAGAVCNLLLAMAPGAHAAFGKQRLAALLLICADGEQLACASPTPGGAPLAGSAPLVLAAALSAALGREPEAPSASGFRSSRGAACIPAHVKVNAGLLFPLRTGLAFVSTSKPCFLPVSRWDGVAVGRAGGGTNATFDLRVGDVEFGMISRDELPAVQEYVASRTRALERQAAARAAADGEPIGVDAQAAAAAVAGGEHDSDEDEDDDSFHASEGAGASDGSGGGSDDSDSDADAGWGMVAAGGSEEDAAAASKKARQA